MTNTLTEEYDLISRITSNDKDRYGNVSVASIFLDKMDKIYSNSIGAMKTRIHRITDDTKVIKGTTMTKLEYKINSTYNSNMMQGYKGMLRCHNQSSKRYVPQVDYNYLLKPTILLDIRDEGRLITRLLNDKDYDVADTLDKITNKKVRLKVEALLDELDEVPNIIEAKGKLPTRGNTLAEDLLCDLEAMLQGEDF